MGTLCGMPAICHFRELPQSGAAAIETTLSLFLILLVATAVMEFSYWGVVRQLNKLALHETLRIAVSEHGTQRSLDQAFAAVRHSRLTQPWSLRIIEPDTNILADFQDPYLSAQYGHPVIRHDSQREQHQRSISRRINGSGTASGKTIFEANILVVELTYQHRLISPWFRQWLGSADTRLRLQAAMQSDFHASSSPSTRLNLPGTTSNAFRPVTEAPPLSIKKVRDIDRGGENHTYELNLKPIRTDAKTLTPSVSEAEVIPLQPDLAEQCGTLMCCFNPS